MISELKPIRVMKSSFNNPSNAGILSCSSDSLFVVDLFVDLTLIDMGSVSNDDLDLVLGRKELFEFYCDHEPDHLGH